MLGARTAAWAKGGTPLPYLRRVAYLESHGTEYLQTDITPKIGCSIKCEYLYNVLPVNQDYQTLFSAGTGTCQLIALGAVVPVGLNPTDGFYYKYFASGGAANFYYYPQTNTKYSLSVNSNGVARIGLYSSTSSPVSELDGSKTTLHILKRSNGTSAMLGKLFSFLMNDENGNEILNIIPVLDFTERPCMYNQAPLAVPADDLSRFFYNQGTGEFTWGEL